MMKTHYFVHVMSDTKNRSWIWSSLFVASLFFVAYLIGGAFISKEYKDRIIRWGVNDALPNKDTSSCKSRCIPSGSEPLPKGIVAKTSNLEMQPLWGSLTDYKKSAVSKNLLAIAVGVKQKEIVNQIVLKFPASDFVVMLFHYDGLVNEWMNLEWSNRAIHISAVNQTKWWFAKRFLHPDIVSDYNYVFLWDEDVGVDNFDPIRYLSIVKSEGLEISQPALDPVKSDVHHPITARSSKSRVHRRMYKNKGSGLCDSRSTAPPCVGWVEMMVPVFSKASWRCSWHMIQNDLIHAWGLDQLLGYCAQGDRTKRVGVVDSEFIVHLGLPTLGVTKVQNDSRIHSSNANPVNETTVHSLSGAIVVDKRGEVRLRSSVEMEIFRKRWKQSVLEDPCWVDPFQQKTMNHTRRRKL